MSEVAAGDLNPRDVNRVTALTVVANNGRIDKSLAIDCYSNAIEAAIDQCGKDLSERGISFDLSAKQGLLELRALDIVRIKLTERYD